MSLVLPVSPALRVLLALPVPRVSMVWVSLDPRDLPVHLAPLAVLLLANLDPQVDLANLATTEPQVRRETPEPLVSRDPEEPLEPLEALDQLASPLLASLDPLVSLEQWDLVESLVIRDTPVFLACQALRVIEVLVLLDLRVRQDPRDQWAQ